MDTVQYGGIVPSFTSLCGLLALCINARDVGSYQNNRAGHTKLFGDNGDGMPWETAFLRCP